MTMAQQGQVGYEAKVLPRVHAVDSLGGPTVRNLCWYKDWLYIIC